MPRIFSAPPQRYWHIHVYCYTIHISQEIEPFCISINEGMNNQNAVNRYIRTLQNYIEIVNYKKNEIMTFLGK